MQCCTCSKWFHLRCSLLFFCRFKVLSSSDFWSYPPYCVLASRGGLHPLRAPPACISPLFNLVNLALFYQCSAPCHTLVYKHPTLLPLTLYLLPLHPHPLYSGCSPIPPASSQNSLRVLQWNVRSFRARSVQFHYFVLLYPVDLNCI